MRACLQSMHACLLLPAAHRCKPTRLLLRYYSTAGASTARASAPRCRPRSCAAASRVSHADIHGCSLPVQHGVLMLVGRLPWPPWLYQPCMPPFRAPSMQVPHTSSMHCCQRSALQPAPGLQCLRCRARSRTALCGCGPAGRRPRCRCPASRGRQRGTASTRVRWAAVRLGGRVRSLSPCLP